MRPHVALTTYNAHARWGVWDRHADLLPVTYARAIADAGGIPLLLPTLPTALADDALTGVAALVLVGGPDVDRAAIRESDHNAEPGGDESSRDRWEAALLRAALRRGMPLLGVCRGMQLMNACFGGSLHEHLPDVVGNDHHLVGDGVFGQHAVNFAVGSHIARIFGEASTVTTYHHQAVDRVGTGLVATGWAADGVVEATEFANHAFAVGVQWHPEEDDDRRLFKALVCAAAGNPPPIQ